MYVVAAGPEYKELVRNALDDSVMATPAISEGVLYFRTRQSLVAVSRSRASVKFQARLPVVNSSA